LKTEIVTKLKNKNCEKIKKNLIFTKQKNETDKTKQKT
jgi:hypothetical protein